MAASSHQNQMPVPCLVWAHPASCLPRTVHWLVPLLPNCHPPDSVPLRPELASQLLRDTLLLHRPHPQLPGSSDLWSRSQAQKHPSALPWPCRGRAPSPAPQPGAVPRLVSPLCRQEGRPREAQPLTPGHTTEKSGGLASGPCRAMMGGRTYLTQVGASESKPPSERPRAPLYSGPWARWPVGTPQAVQVVSSISPGARPTPPPPGPQLEPSPAGAWQPPGSSGCCPRTGASQPGSLQAGEGVSQVPEPLPHNGGAHSRCKAAGLRHPSASTTGPRAESGCPHPQLPTSPSDFRQWQCQQSGESGPDPKQISKEHLLRARHQSQDYCGLRRKQVQLRLGWGSGGPEASVGR